MLTALILSVCIFCSATANLEWYPPKHEPLEVDIKGVRMATAGIDLEVIRIGDLKYTVKPRFEGFSSWQDFRKRDYFDVLGEYDYSIDKWEPTFTHLIEYQATEKLKFSMENYKGSVHYWLLLRAEYQIYGR